MNKPLCFILMPYGEKTGTSGTKINFDVIYKEWVHPAIEAAGLEPIRAEEKEAGDTSRRAMYERLILCDYAVIDLGSANAGVFYQLGVRHAVRPFKTVLLFNDKMQPPFHPDMLSSMPYKLDGNGRLMDKNKHLENLKKSLEQLKERNDVDSPLFQIFQDEWQQKELDSLKTDIFREQVTYSQQVKEKLSEARKKGAGEVREIEKSLGDLNFVESGILIDLLLSYRATEAWEDMIVLLDKMPKPLAERMMVQEQLAFALNRNGQGEKAEKILLQVIERNGPGSETYGLLGRVYKDRWEKADKDGETSVTAALLEKAIDSYVKGFESDWRDAYPGINAVTLMELKDSPDARQEKLLPVVSYAAEQKLKRVKPDYWGYATLLELAVLGNDQKEAKKWLKEALMSIRETWEPETTARNLRLIREARQKRGENTGMIEAIEKELQKKM